MADRTQRFALLSRYDKYHQLKYKEKPVYNKWSEQWAADALVESYGLDACLDLLEYYFDTARSPDWKYFSNYAQDIITAKKQKEQDDKERAERREMARSWLNE
jgi:hypothetical protein